MQVGPQRAEANKHTACRLKLSFYKHVGGRAAGGIKIQLAELTLDSRRDKYSN